MKTQNKEEENATLYWKVNTGGLLKEILSNNETAIFLRPLQIFQSLLIQVGKRASELNDPKLNALMCRLSIYAESDPFDKENYNADLTEKTIQEGMKS